MGIPVPDAGLEQESFIGCLATAYPLINNVT